MPPHRKPRLSSNRLRAQYDQSALGHIAEEKEDEVLDSNNPRSSSGSGPNWTQVPPKSLHVSLDGSYEEDFEVPPYNMGLTSRSTSPAESFYEAKAFDARPNTAHMSAPVSPVESFQSDKALEALSFSRCQFSPPIGPIGADEYFQGTKTCERRYYAHALTPEDKAALNAGDHTHEWTSEDLIRYEVSREQLLRPGLQGWEEMQEKKRLEREEREKMKDERRRSAWWTGGSSSAPSSPGKRASRSPQRVVQYPASPSDTPRLSSLSDIRRYRNEESKMPTRGFLAARPQAPRSVSAPAKDPSITFDSFLSPHASGKGEAYRGARNARA